MGLFEVASEHFDGEVKVFRPMTFEDERGSLTITRLQSDPFCLPSGLILRQMHTRSKKNVLRGLHFQLKPPMGKLIQVINGSVFTVAVDIRPESPTFLKYHSAIMSGDNHLQVWASSKFARGYYVLEDNTIVQYSCDEYFGEDRALCWNDPDIGIDWPGKEPLLSRRDKNAPSVQEYFGRIE